MSSQRIHPGLIGATVVCFAFTAAFTAGVISKSSDVRRLLEGDTPSAVTVPKLLDQRSKLREDIAGLENGLQIRKTVLERADVDLSGHLVYYQDAELLGGIATPGVEEAIVRGVSTKLKLHRLAMAQAELVEMGKRMEALKAEYASDSRQTFPPLEKAIKDRQAELRAVSDKIAAMDAVYQKDRQDLVDRLDKLNADRDKADKTARTERSTRQTKISQLEDRIRQLLELDLRWLTEIEPVGQILQVEDRSGRVIINLGSSERAFPGLLFEVFNFEKGAFVEKGMIEVIEVKDGISVCRILSQKDRKIFPMTKEDRIGNPTFNPKRPKTFMIAGEFDKFNKSDLEAFVRRSGGVVVDKLGPGVDFLVVRGDSTDRSDRERAQAREYQILGMKEDQLLKFVQPLFPPK